MTKLVDIAKIIRSKNSGPFELTLDVMFDDPAVFQAICDRKLICKKTIAGLYHLKEEDVLSIIEFPVAMAIKATIVRPLSSGAIGERDVYGAQQHVPLMQLEVPDWEED